MLNAAYDHVTFLTVAPHGPSLNAAPARVLFPHLGVRFGAPRLTPLNHQERLIASDRPWSPPGASDLVGYAVSHGLSVGLPCTTPHDSRAER